MGNLYLVLLFPLLTVLYITIDAANLRCYNGTFSSYADVSLDTPLSLFNLTFFNSTKPTVFYMFGFNGEATGQSVITTEETYLSSGKYNVLLVNWEKEASSGILGDLGYPIAISNCKDVGEKLGQALVKLFNAGLNPNTTVLIGFSLGAHCVGYGARVVQNTLQTNISKIVGLDPAGPLFDGNPFIEELDASCATFVLIIDTNPGHMGSNKSVGTVNIWPNCKSSVQPNCTGGGFGVRTPENMCSHNRSWIYYGEALTRPGSFVGRYGTSCSEWHDQSPSNVTFTIQEDVDTNARGNFYLNTYSAPYYGRGEEGSYPN